VGLMVVIVGGGIQKSEILNVKKERKIKRSRVAQE